jgi:hypothetical protein
MIFPVGDWWLATGNYQYVLHKHKIIFLKKIEKRANFSQSTGTKASCKLLNANRNYKVLKKNNT